MLSALPLLLLPLLLAGYLCQAIYVECVVPLQLAQLVQLRNGHMPRGGLAVLGLAVNLSKELLQKAGQEAQEQEAWCIRCVTV
jgi:hypothetical protein